MRRDRILSHPRSYYERLYKVMVDGRHPLLARFAAAEGYPSRHLHNLFLEAHWHWIFGEPERYQPPFESCTAISALRHGRSARRDRIGPRMDAEARRDAILGTRTAERPE